MLLTNCIFFSGLKYTVLKMIKAMFSFRNHRPIFKKGVLFASPCNAYTKKHKKNTIIHDIIHIYIIIKLTREIIYNFERIIKYPKNKFWLLE